MNQKITHNNGRYVELGNQTYKNFSTTSYLNLAFEKNFQELIIEGLSTYGSVHGLSPLTEPRLQVYELLEKQLASYYRSEEAILFSNGFAAVQAVVKTVASLGNQIEYGAMSHPALEIESKGSSIAYASNIADPINPAILSSLEIENKPSLIIDASHGFGVLDDYIQELTPKAIVCGSLNKGLSTPAGLVLCKSELRSAITSQSIYNTSSAPSPALCFALLKAFEHNIIDRQKEKLNSLLTQINPSEKYHYASTFPVLRLNNSSPQVLERFLGKGMLLWHNQYPKNSGEIITRAVVHAGLEKEDIYELLEGIESLT